MKEGGAYSKRWVLERERTGGQSTRLQGHGASRHGFERGGLQQALGSEQQGSRGGAREHFSVGGRPSRNRDSIGNNSTRRMDTRDIVCKELSMGHARPMGKQWPKTYQTSQEGAQTRENRRGNRSSRATGHVVSDTRRRKTRAEVSPEKDWIRACCDKEEGLRAFHVKKR